MSNTFDPYHQWLGIPPKDQPPHHYRLLGIDLFEKDRAVIEAAANRQMNYLQQLSSGENIEHAQQLLGEVSRARVCLLNAEKKSAYDKQLRSQLATEESQKVDVGDDRKQTAPSRPAEIPPFPGIDFGSRAEQDPSPAAAKFPPVKTAAVVKQTHPSAAKHLRKKNPRSLQITLSVATVVVMVAAFIFLYNREQTREVHQPRRTSGTQGEEMRQDKAKQAEQAAPKKANRRSVTSNARDATATQKILIPATTKRTPTEQKAPDDQKRVPQTTIKKQATAQWEEKAAAQREEKAAAQREEKAAAQREEKAAAQREEKAAAQREEKAAAQREEKAAAQREEKAAAQRERQREHDRRKQDARETLAQKGLEAKDSVWQYAELTKQYRALNDSQSEPTENNRFASDKSRQLKNRARDLRNKYKKLEKDPKVQDALRVLGDRLATAPSRPMPASRKSLTPASGNSGLDQLIRATQVIPDNDTESDFEDTPRNDEEFHERFVQDDKSGKWTPKEEASLKEEIQELRKEIHQYKQTVDRQVKLLATIKQADTELKRLQLQANKKIAPEEIKKEMNNRIGFWKRQIPLLKAKKATPKNKPNDTAIIGLLSRVKKKVTQIEAMTLKYKDFRYKEESDPVKINTKIEKRSGDFKRLEADFNKNRKKLGGPGG